MKIRSREKITKAPESKHAWSLPPVSNQLLKLAVNHSHQPNSYSLYNKKKVNLGQTTQKLSPNKKCQQSKLILVKVFVGGAMDLRYFLMAYLAT